MKRFFALLFLSLVVLPLAARTISYVEKSGSWYYVYDQYGHQYKSASASYMGDLQGFSGYLVIFKSGSFYYICDTELKKIKSMSVSSVGTIVAVAGETFTTKRGSFVYTYDKNGRQIASHSAR